MRSLSIPLLSMVLALPAVASDGVLEINQTCAVQTGCFAGDAAGFPVTITAAGSYRLTSSLTLPNESTSAIRVATSDVGIDLNRFAIVGVVTCSGSPLICSHGSGTGSGVDRTDLTVHGVSVANGAISGMGFSGVALGDQSELTNLRVRWNRVDGLLFGDGSLARGCTAYQNGDDGISGGAGVTVSDASAYQNGNDGILVGIGSTVSQSAAYDNGGSGMLAAAGTSIVANAAYSNAEVGILVGNGATVSDNAAYQNGSDGITAAAGAAITGNAAYDNGDANLPANDDGIQCASGCVVRDNSVRGNSGHGLNLASDSAYSENVVTNNSTGTVTGLGSANTRGGNYCAGTGTASAFCP